MRTTSKKRWLASAMSVLLVAALACLGLAGCASNNEGASSPEPAKEPAASQQDLEMTSSCCSFVSLMKLTA